MATDEAIRNKEKRLAQIQQNVGVNDRRGRSHRIFWMTDTLMRESRSNKALYLVKGPAPFDNFKYLRCAAASFSPRHWCGPESAP
jgi:hypothetical protein